MNIEVPKVLINDRYLIAVVKHGVSTAIMESLPRPSRCRAGGLCYECSITTASLY